MDRPHQRRPTLNRPFPPPDETIPAWIAPLAATLLLQTTAAFLSRVTPALAPVLTAEAGVAPTMIGHLSALGTAGSIAFLVMGAPLIRRAGPIRTLQIGTLASGLGTLLILRPSAGSLILASILIGVGYGPSPSAGSEILQRHAPTHRRSLIFSIKQAGVPAGGVLAGLALPLLAALDWRIAIVVSSALALAAVAMVQPLRGRIDAARDRTAILTPGAFLAWSNVSAPIRALGLSPDLPKLTAAACCFAFAQGALLAFFVTWLVVDLHYSLASAGALFAIMQATGVAGRVLVGWVADRTGSPVGTLCVLAISSAATVTVIAAGSAAWPVWAFGLVAAVAGVTVTSWNGLFLAEIARLTPSARIAESTAGSTLLTFAGYVIGPSAFALLVEATGSYRIGFAATALFSLAALAILTGMRRSG